MRHRTEYQRLYTEGMLENLNLLHDAEDRRAKATPSSLRSTRQHGTRRKSPPISGMKLGAVT